MDLNSPRLTVIVPAMLGRESVGAAITAWEAQDARASFDLVVAEPAHPGEMLHCVRANAIRGARGKFVFIAEDHCLPEPHLVRKLLNSIDRNGWDAVAPALHCAQPQLAWQAASFLLGYGQWMHPVSGGATQHLPGHNIAVRRDALLAMGPELEHELLIAAFLVRRLHRRGLRLGLETSASMRHFDLGRFDSFPVFYTVGLGFGARRTAQAGIATRALYWLAAPAVALRHFLRGWTHYRRAGAAAGLHPRCLPTAAVLATIWALGEAAGALQGVHRVAPRLWRSEVKPVSLEQAQMASPL